MLDADRLKESWRNVTAHGDQVPLFFYSTLFLTHPHTREMFPVSMASQRDKLVAALGRVISRVDDLDSVVPVVQQLGRDHRRFGVEPDDYPAVGDALLATLEHFSGPDWTPELARDWAAAYEIVSGVMIAAAKDASEAPPWWDATVTRVERRTVGVAVLTVRPHVPLSFRAGQSVAVEAPTRPRLWRYYTPATLAASDGSFELHVRLVPGGQVSTALVQTTQEGDVLRLGAPVGEALTLGDGAHDVVMLAGGTGLAPMKALLQQMRAQGDRRRACVYWGARYHHELYDLVAMRELTASGQPDMRLVPCVSHEPITVAGVESGTVADVMQRDGPLTDLEIYICGSPEMVAATRDAAWRAGAPDHLVHVEHFGNEETGT